jgi:hypothetical protein
MAQTQAEKYGKRVESVDEHEDRPGQTLVTKSHEVIQRWAEKRGATPATATRRGGDPATLRFDFPGYGGGDLEKITWDEWFHVFDDRNLNFIYQEHKADGSESNFFQLESPSREDA